MCFAFDISSVVQEEKAALKADVEIWQDEQRRSRANAEEMSATISNLKAALEDGIGTSHLVEIAMSDVAV